MLGVWLLGRDDSVFKQLALILFSNNWPALALSFGQEAHSSSLMATCW